MTGNVSSNPRVPEGYEPVLDDDGKSTGYYREIATGEIVTFTDEYDDE